MRDLNTLLNGVDPVHGRLHIPAGGFLPSGAQEPPPDRRLLHRMGVTDTGRCDGDLERLRMGRPVGHDDRHKKLHAGIVGGRCVVSADPDGAAGSEVSRALRSGIPADLSGRWDELDPRLVALPGGSPVRSVCSLTGESQGSEGGAVNFSRIGLIESVASVRNHCTRKERGDPVLVCFVPALYSAYKLHP